MRIRNKRALNSAHIVANTAENGGRPIAANCNSCVIAACLVRPTRLILQQNACQAAGGYVGLGAFEPKAAVGARSKKALGATLFTDSL